MKIVLTALCGDFFPKRVEKIKATLRLLFCISRLNLYALLFTFDSC